MKARSRAAQNVCALAVVGLAAGALVGTAGSAGAAPARHVYLGSVPGFVSAKTDAGPAADTTVEGEVFLSLRNEVGAQAFATAVSTPGNPAYGKYLSPAAWIAKYSPTKATLNAVEKYLIQSGQTIYATPASRQYIVFRGPAATAGAAFGTTLHNYRVSGKLVSAPSKAASLPSSIASAVSGVTLGNARASLTRPTNVRQDTVATAAPKGVAKAAARTKINAAAVPNCSNYWNEYSVTVPKAYGQTTAPVIPCGYLPAQLRSSANLDKTINSGYDGSGQTIGIVDAYASPTILQDTNDYMRSVGSPLLTSFSQLNPGPFQDEAACQEPSGWQAEEAIDVQSSHSLAPGAKILYSGGFNCGGGLDIAVSKILDKHLAGIISNSYGEPEFEASNDDLRGEVNIDLQAAGEGIGMYYSTGDDGDNLASAGQVSPGFTASSPFVTAVGGVSQGIGAKGTVVFQTGWGTTLDPFVNGKYEAPLPGEFLFGAGGGISAAFAEPRYQYGTVPTSLSGHGANAARVTPDVSDLADPETGFQIAIRPITDDSTLATGPLEFDTYGGTSLATPMVAAKLAIVQQLSGHPIGFANPGLYAAGRTAGRFHDVQASNQLMFHHSTVTGNNNVFVLDKDTSLKTTNNYDDVTGIGTLNVAGLAKYFQHTG